MSSGGKGNSRAQTSSTTNNTQNTTNAVDNRVFGEGAITIEGTGNTVSTTDFGAIQAAGELGAAALELGRSSLVEGADLAGRGLDNAFDFGRSTVGGAFDFGGDTVSEAFSFGTRSLDSVTGFADQALQTNAGLARDSLDFASELTDGVLGFGRELVGDTVKGFKDLQLQTTATSDDRVQKIAMYAFAAIAAAIVLPKLFGKS